MRSKLALLALALTACGEEAPPRTEPTAPVAIEPVVAMPPAVAAPAGPPNDEVCAEAIVVQWQGASGAPESITRSEGDARVRIEGLLTSIESGQASFNDVARADSDARSSGARGGLIGTYSHGDWPPQHEAIRERAFALQPGQTSEVLQAPYGWVILHRCATEYRHTRHVLIRFAGARNAGDVSRTREEALALAQTARGQILATDADFTAIARQISEDGSAQRGGDLGWLGRGRLAPAYEEAAFTLAVGATSEPIETEFGFHVIQRVE
jgi:peptidyl-prolyl cis-trans isomerase SurA